MKEIKITRKYSFWRHPIRWFKDRKKFKILNLMFNHWYEKEGKEELAKAQMDMMLYGRVIMKDGKVISYEDYNTRT